jgi:hypothetical protein
MNTCNYTTPYPVASHVEGGVIQSNGLRLITNYNSPMDIQDTATSTMYVGLMIMLAVIGVLIGLVYYLFKKNI